MEARMFGTTVENGFGTTYIFETLAEAQAFYACLQGGSTEATCVAATPPKKIFKPAPRETFGL